MLLSNLVAQPSRLNEIFHTVNNTENKNKGGTDCIKSKRNCFATKRENCGLSRRENRSTNRNARNNQPPHFSWMRVCLDASSDLSLGTAAETVFPESAVVWLRASTTGLRWEAWRMLANFKPSKLLQV